VNRALAASPRMLLKYFRAALREKALENQQLQKEKE
jgi:hypothetical protein